MAKGWKQLIKRIRTLVPSPTFPAIQERHGRTKNCFSYFCIHR